MGSDSESSSSDSDSAYDSAADQNPNPNPNVEDQSPSLAFSQPNDAVEEEEEAEPIRAVEEEAKDVVSCAVNGAEEEAPAVSEEHQNDAVSVSELVNHVVGEEGEAAPIRAVEDGVRSLELGDEPNDVVEEDSEAARIRAVEDGVQSLDLGDEPNDVVSCTLNGAEEAPTVSEECQDGAVGTNVLDNVEIEEKHGGLSSTNAHLEERESGSVVWRVNSEVQPDAPESPSSSGYAGERGSSSASSGSGIEEDEIREVQDGDSINGGANPQQNWVPGKRHVDEDDASLSWRKRKKHFFILSHSGKPIYSRYGDEHKLAGFSATLQAIISFVENGGDRVKLVRAGKHQVVFLVKGPIYLVCISCTEEPYESLRGQLDLIYGQMILILTKSVNRCFEKNPKFDMTPLLGGTDVVFSSLIHSFSWNPATFLHAYTCLPLAYPTRQAAGAILQDVADSGVLFAILMCKHKVVSLVGAQKASFHPDDVLLLSNFVMSSESFRTSENFSPICLPRYNPMAFLYAYVHYFDADTYLMLLTTSSDAFYHLKECRIRIEAVLLKSNVLSEVQRSMLDGGMHVEDLPVDPSPRSGSSSPHLGHHSPESFRDPYASVGGPTGLWHFIYRSIYLDQYISSEFSSPINTPRQQKRLYRAYQKIYASMHDKGFGPHRTQFRRDENYVLLCWVTQDFELYAAFDPLADKAMAIKTCNRVCQWVKDVENEIFLLGASPFSW